MRGEGIVDARVWGESFQMVGARRLEGAQVALNHGGEKTLAAAEVRMIGGAGGLGDGAVG
ncbi:hypothetical protein HMPREF0305_10368 [Corynebacterium pseudogenitalium ATCC 33035]|uniref:Uncharacterized protein n=1 Tax=Corynebacterium pseudogenitalium ATCC 33035 TaxID=525264 RepID=E2S1G6_9CORY|nr:hypothetical protein HMPREF0305_10368 [Corynebacterium pseudogenitalium ATCC 33035]